MGKYAWAVVGIGVIVIVFGLYFFGAPKTESPTKSGAEVHPSIVYSNANNDLIQVELPFPGAVTGKTFSVIGKARGPWFFEGSFPVELRDKDGNILDQKPAQAKGEWMTSDFVPFSVELTAPQTYIGPATLILKKDNPSGEPQNDASISFGITVEY